MLFLVVFLLLCTAMVWWAVLPLIRLRDPDPATAGESEAAPPASLEGVLVAQMMAGEITVGQYRRAVERLAARDDERHPLTVPPELGPAGS
ncbi:hypothetical protein ODJ79_37485 [Actinoplanes sp. KI2]|uniref:hypothetical protein n=1 Tax=Actinoplanes sp. KI2 TaxID=2983315 RepID=UPI0021D57346|nr:hypothetical protein [Actinoplanes sp. KI2]MCU7729442.1 hypothetical protein [Actinoplanes sp. KI2]